MPNTENHGRFSWHELLTSDPEAARRFYTQVVGWTAQESRGGEAPYTLFYNGEVPAAGMMKTPPEAAAMGTPPNWFGYVEVDDIDATVEAAKKLGATILGTVMSVEGFGRFAVMQDPQGAVIGLLSHAFPLPPESGPTPLEFSWHELITSDLAGAIRFYESLFGWKKQSEFDMGAMGKYHMFGRDRFTYGGMMQKTAEMPMSTWLYYVRVPDSADDAAARAVKAGAKTFIAPMEVPGGDRVAALFDPQGAAFAVHSKSEVAQPSVRETTKAATHSRM